MKITWSAKRSKQSILKDINPEYSLQGLMLKLKLQYLIHLIRSAISLERTLLLDKLKAKGERCNRGLDGWVASVGSMDMNVSKLRETVKDRKAWRAAAHRVSESQTLLSNRTTTL